MFDFEINIDLLEVSSTINFNIQGVQRYLPVLWIFYRSPVFFLLHIIYRFLQHCHYVGYETLYTG